MKLLSTLIAAVFAVVSFSAVAADAGKAPAAKTDAPAKAEAKPAKKHHHARKAKKADGKADAAAK